MALFSDAILLAEITVVGRTKRKRRRDIVHTSVLMAGVAGLKPLDITPKNPSANLLPRPVCHVTIYSGWSRAMASALDSATTGYICCSQIGAGFLGIANYGNVAANWPLAMIGNGALMSLLQSDSNQVAGRFLDQQVRWRRYLVFFLVGG
jgi:hypothetical protein